MKKITLLLFAGLTMIFNTKSNGQDKNHPWAIGFGTNFIDISNAGVSEFGAQTKDYFRIDKDLNNVPFVTRVYVAKYLKNGFTADLTGSFNQIDEGANGEVPEENYYSADLGLRYDINRLWGKSGWFDPYAKFSIGAIWVDKDMGAVLSPAFGFNTWFNDSVGLNFETAYRSNAAFGNDTQLGSIKYIPGYHFQHSVSVVFRFGDPIEQEPEFIDSDGDKIADINDRCPNVAGTIRFQGCPDTDGDLVQDSKDKCPNIAGAVEDGGCPDSDHDGLADPNDKCPNEFGPIKNNGCPWPDTDGDGVTDNIDNCVNVKGPKSNVGCPVRLTEAAKIELGEYAKIIQFNVNSAEFKPGVTKILDKVANVMNKFEGVKFDIEGHCDSQGNDAYNLKLSRDRAQAVVNYLSTHGIEEWRLKAVGYGETKPIASNATAIGRSLNRRVVISAIEEDTNQ
ncbi:OmpA family protein [Wenyingzhuangia sp. IMCC45533]